MKQTIEIPTSLFQRLSFHAKGFDTPAMVIERLLNSFEGQKHSESVMTVSNTFNLPTSLNIVYHPSDEESFKQELLKKKVAYLLLHKIDGTKEFKQWNASNFQPNSSVNGNLRSGYLRGWKNRGIIKAEISTNRSDLE